MHIEHEMCSCVELAKLKKKHQSKICHFQATALWRSGASAYRMEPGTAPDVFPRLPTPPIEIQNTRHTNLKEFCGVCFSLGGVSTAEEDECRRRKCILDSTKQLTPTALKHARSSTKKIIKQSQEVPSPSVSRKLHLRILRLPKKFPHDTFSPFRRQVKEIGVSLVGL
jgi:hypothetical protein